MVPRISDHESLSKPSGQRFVEPLLLVNVFDDVRRLPACTPDWFNESLTPLAWESPWRQRFVEPPLDDHGWFDKSLTPRAFGNPWGQRFVGALGLFVTSEHT